MQSEKSATNLIKSKGQSKPLAKAEQKPKTDEILSPEELKIAKLYKAGKLKGKTFDNLDELHKHLNS